MLNLTVASGPDKGRVFTLLDQESRTMGRGEGPRALSDRTASRRHVQFFWRDGQWYVGDLGSTNGTFHNGQRLEGEALLSDGDQVQIGCTLLLAGLVTNEDATVAGNVAVIRPPTPTGPRRGINHDQGQHHDTVPYGHGAEEEEDMDDNSRSMTVVAPRSGAPAPVMAYSGPPQAPARQTGSMVGWALVAVTVLALLVLVFDIYFNQKRDTQRMLEAIIKEVRQPQPTQDFSPLLKDLKEAMQSQSAESSQRIEKLMGELWVGMQSTNEPKTQEQFKQILGALERVSQKPDNAQNQALLEQIHVMLQEQSRDPKNGQTEVLLKQILSTLELRPSAGTNGETDALLKQVLEAVKQPAQAQNNEEIESMLKQVLAAVEQPSQPQGGGGETDALLQQVLARLDEQPVGEGTGESEALLKQILATLEKQPQEQRSGETDALLQQVLTKLDAQSEAKAGETDALLQQVLARLDEQPVGERTGESDALLKQILATLEKQPKEQRSGETDALLQQVLAKLDKQSEAKSGGETEGLLKEILAKLNEPAPMEPIGQTDLLFQQILTELERKPGAQQDTETKALLEKVVATLERQQERPSEASRGETDGLLKQILAKLDQQPAPPRDLSRDLSRELEASQAARDAALEEKITSAIASLRQEQAQARQEMLDQVRAAIGETEKALASAAAQPAQSSSEPMLTKILTELQAQRQVLESMPSPEDLAMLVKPAAGQRGGVSGAAETKRPAAVAVGPKQQEVQVPQPVNSPDVPRAAAGSVVARGVEPASVGPAQAAVRPVSAEPVATGAGQGGSTTTVSVSVQGAERRAGGEVAASVDALTASGNPRRVVYLIDASGSLIDSMPQVLSELHGSLDQLKDDQQFTVIFFQRDKTMEVPPVGLKPASLQGIARVKAWTSLNSGHVVPGGFSNPVGALQEAMSYRPQQVYLFSDSIAGTGPGEVSHGKLLAEVERLNPGHAVTINTVQFFYPDPNDTLKMIALANGGRYRFIGESKPLVLPTAATSVGGQAGPQGGDDQLLTDELIDMLLSDPN